MGRPEQRVRQAAARAAIVLVGFVGAGCGPSGEEPSAAPRGASDEIDFTGRRIALRERLKEELGELYDQPLPEATEEQLARGAEHWELLCSNCHGRQGGGTRQLSRLLPVPPGDLRDPERARFFSERAKLAIIADGIEGTPMIGWKDLLSEAELRGVLAHLETLVREDE